MLDDFTGKEIWDKELAPRHAVDFGIYGNTAEVLFMAPAKRRTDRLPCEGWLVVMIGAANLIDRKPASGIVAVITACVQEMRRRQPQAVIFLFCTPRVAVGFLDDGFEARATAVAREIGATDDGPGDSLDDMTSKTRSFISEGPEGLRLIRCRRRLGMQIGADLAEAEADMPCPALTAPLSKAAEPCCNDFSCARPGCPVKRLPAPPGG